MLVYHLLQYILSIEGDIIKAKPFITHGTTAANTYITDPDIKDPNATNTN